ncbi:MAG: hypothetical protein RL885_19950 [Planctomycetota bacterium]
MLSMIRLGCVSCLLVGISIAQPTWRVSVSPTGAPGDADSGEFAGWTQPTIVSSGARYVFFGSRATNLVANDTNGCSDVFRRDLRTGETIRVSVGPDGEQLTSDSFLIDASDVGIFALFATRQAVIPELDSNEEFDLYVRRVNRDRTELASVRSSGTAVGAFFGAISDTGRYVAFASESDRVVIPWDENGVTDVFRYDFQERKVVICSRSESGNIGNDHSGAGAGGTAIGVAIAGDGSAVAFTSLATNLVEGDHNGCADVFFHDPFRLITLRASERLDGQGGNGPSSVGPFSVNWDGRLVLFRSEANNLVEGDTGFADIFVWGQGPIRRLSETADGQQPDGDSYLGAMTRHAEEVSFLSAASNLVPGDTNGRIDVFVRRLNPDRLQRVNLSYTGAETSSPRLPGFDGYISSFGDAVAFTSRAADLVRGAQSEHAQAYARSLFSVELEGTPAAGSPVRFRFEKWADAGPNLAIVLFSCSGTGGIPLPGGRFVPLTFDAWTAAGLTALPLLSSELFNTGRGWTPVYPFPSVPSGIRVFTAAVAIDANTQQIEAISGPSSFVTQ